MAEYIESLCRRCFHSYVCEQFNEHRDSENNKCHFFNDHFVPAADVVNVVRCGQCKHFGGVITAYTCRLHSTGNTRIQMRENDFCSYGERRESDE